MKLSKSKYCNGFQCDKILWLEKNKPEVKEEIDNSSVLENGNEVGKLAKGLFGDYIDIEFNENLNNMIEDTKNALNNKNCVICEASFNYNDNFCSVDILKKNNNEYELYEVKSSTDVSDIYKEDASYQYYVLKSLGLNVVKCSIVHLNNEYYRHGELDLNKLFKIVDVTEYAKSNFKNVKNKIDEINKYMKNKNEPKKDIGIWCHKPYPCPFYNYCTKDLNKPNVFDIRGMNINKKYDFYNKGLVYFKDLIKENINDKYKEQIDFELNNKEDKININNIKKFLNTIKYPIYFLDFETYQQPIPLYDNICPYMQIPFQYSLHYIESKESKVMHKEFLSSPSIDPRRNLALRLVNDIPKDVCVLAYNMMFEKMVIKHLAHIYPDLEDHLMNIYNNIKDLMIPFKNRDYYTKEMYGSYSIKYVLPALFPNEPTLDYHNLEMVHNGSEASNTFASLDKYSGNELEEIKKNMLKYCELDTYAMVKIWQKLNEVVEK